MNGGLSQYARILIDAYDRAELEARANREWAEQRSYGDAAAQAAISADWNETNALHDEAWQRYTRHKDAAQYKRDCAEIDGRK